MENLSADVLKSFYDSVVKKLLAPRRQRDGCPIINADGLVVRQSKLERAGVEINEGKQRMNQWFCRRYYMVLFHMSKQVFFSTQKI